LFVVFFFFWRGRGGSWGLCLVWCCGFSFFVLFFFFFFRVLFFFFFFFLGIVGFFIIMLQKLYTINHVVGLIISC